jgi:glycosyltransferase involved in cell wall biosynthesis
MVPRISVALATFNGERYLRRQLASLAQQSHRPFELVVVDDGSTDKTIAIVRSFAKTAPFPVRIYENERRLGYRKNFVLAAQHCDGDLISFCDQDDIWAVQKLDLVSKAFADPAVLLAFHNAKLIDANGKAKGKLFGHRRPARVYDPLELEPWTIVPGFAQVIRRSLLEFSNLHDRSRDMYSLSNPMPHDQWFPFLASALGKVAYVPGVLAYYRQHDLNVSGWLPAKPLAYTLHNIAHAKYYALTALDSIASRIELLPRLKTILPVAYAQQIERAVARYAEIKNLLEARLTLYNARSLRKRANVLISLVKRGTYTDKAVNLGLPNLVLDTMIGVPAGNALRKH